MKYSIEIIEIKKKIEDNIDYNNLIYKLSFSSNSKFGESRDIWLFFCTLISGGVKKVLIDMNNISYIDSSGIGILINTAKLIRRDNGDICLFNVSNELKEIFAVVNLQTFIKVCNTEVEGFNFFHYIPVK